MLISVDCGDTVSVSAGRGDDNQIIYDTGYWWDGSSWRDFSYSGNLIETGTPWIQGTANADNIPISSSLQSSGTYVVAWICSLTSSEWRCGCSSQSCTGDSAGFWNLQQIQADSTTGGGGGSGDIPQGGEEVTLRRLAGERGIVISGAPKKHASTDELEVAAQELNGIISHNWMKMRALMPAENTYSFQDSDRMVEYGLANNIRLQSHVLLWHNGQPSWFGDEEWYNTVTLDVLEAFMEDYITTVVSRYRGQFADVQIANELIRTYSDQLKGGPWNRIDNFLVKAF